MNNVTWSKECCCSSVVERVLGKDEVMGSTPISSYDDPGYEGRRTGELAKSQKNKRKINWTLNNGRKNNSMELGGHDNG
jgi:hypothetical protein